MSLQKLYYHSVKTVKDTCDFRDLSESAVSIIQAVLNLTLMQITEDVVFILQP